MWPVDSIWGLWIPGNSFSGEHEWFSAPGISLSSVQSSGTLCQQISEFLSLTAAMVTKHLTTLVFSPINSSVFCPFCASEDYLFCAIIFILCYKRNMHYCYLLLLCISGKWMFCVCEPCTGCSCSVFDLFRCQKWWRNSKNSSQILMFEPRFVTVLLLFCNGNMKDKRQYNLT